MTRGKAKQLRALIERLSALLDDETALTGIELFPEWNVDTDYSVGDRRRKNGKLYKCLIAHRSQSTWTPEDSPSLWAEVLSGQDGTEIDEWVQPDSTNLFMTGDRVLHNGSTWESTIDNNSWEPGVFGWEEVQN